jgi:hypothetical protein
MAKRAALLAHLGLTIAEWRRGHQLLLDYRHQITSRHDLKATLKRNPHYDIVLRVTFFMFERIRTAPDRERLGGIPVDLDYWSKTE